MPDRPTPDVLRKLLRYDPATGKLYWLPRSPDPSAPNDDDGCRRWNTRWAGKEAFTAITHRGYRQGNVMGYHSTKHRVVWAIHTGDWPVNGIDHINGVRDDDRFDNLRDVTQSENLKNTSIRSDNQSGVVGVRWKADRGKWIADIRVNRKSIHIGLYGSLAEAIAARKQAEKAHGFHPNHGKRA